MTCRQDTFGKHCPYFVRQLEQTQRIGNMTAAFSYHFTKIVLGIAILGNQLLIALCFLKRVKVGTLHILDDGNLKCCPVINVAHNNRNFHQASHLGSSPAAFTGDNFISVIRRMAHHNRLHNSVLTNGL